MSELIERAMQLAKELDDKYGPLGISRTVFVKQLHAAGLLSAPSEVMALPSKIGAAEVNALPEPWRKYVMDLETRCDPTGDIQTIHSQRDQIDGLVAQVGELRAEVERLRKIKAALATLKIDHSRVHTIVCDHLLNEDAEELESEDIITVFWFALNVLDRKTPANNPTAPEAKS